MATYRNDQREGEREVWRYKPPWTTRSRGHTYAIQFAICFGFFYTFFDPTELLGFVLFLFIHSTFVNNLLIMFQYSSTESMHNAQFSAMQFKILLSKMMHETTMSEAFISHVSCNEFSPLLPFSFKANFNCFRFSMCFSVANIKRTLHSYYLSNCSCCFSQIKWLASRDTRLRMVWYFFYCMVWTLMFF